MNRATRSVIASVACSTLPALVAHAGVLRVVVDHRQRDPGAEGGDLRQHRRHRDREQRRQRRCRGRLPGAQALGPARSPHRALRDPDGPCRLPDDRVQGPPGDHRDPQADRVPRVPVRKSELPLLRARPGHLRRRGARRQGGGVEPGKRELERRHHAPRRNRTGRGEREPVAGARLRPRPLARDHRARSRGAGRLRSGSRSGSRGSPPPRPGRSRTSGSSPDRGCCGRSGRPLLAERSRFRASRPERPADFPTRRSSTIA